MIKPVKQESHGPQFPYSACACQANVIAILEDRNAMLPLFLVPQTFHTLLIGLPLPKCANLDGPNLVGKAPLLSPQNFNS